MADPGFPVGGAEPLGRPQPPMWVLFGKNICENERIGSRWGCAGSTPLDLLMLHVPDVCHTFFPLCVQAYVIAINQSSTPIRKNLLWAGSMARFDGQWHFRLIWVVRVAAVVILIVYQIADRTQVYCQFNTTVAVSVQYKDQVPFPAVTVCNINTFRLVAIA